MKSWHKIIFLPLFFCNFTPPPLFLLCFQLPPPQHCHEQPQLNLLHQPISLFATGTIVVNLSFSLFTVNFFFFMHHKNHPSLQHCRKPPTLPLSSTRLVTPVATPTLNELLLLLPSPIVCMQDVK